MTVVELLKAGTSYNWAVRYLHEGRITQKTFEHFCLFWDWCAPRFSGSAAIRQERYYNKMGKDAYYRRMERVRRIHDRLVAS